MQPAGLVLAARLDDEPLDEEEQILAATVICGALDVVQRDAGQRVANGDGVGPGDDALLGQHHEMRVVDRHQRRQQLRLGVLEVLIQDEADVVGVERHLISRQSAVGSRESQSSV